MKTENIYLKDGTQVGGFACGNCHAIWHFQRDADRCCVPTVCKECGKENKYVTCLECQAKHSAKREQEAFDRAIKLTPEEYTGEVVHGETKYESVEDALLQLLGDGLEYEDLPNHFCAIEESPMLVLSLNDVVEEAWSHSDNDMIDIEPMDYLNTEALKKGIDEFNEANKDATVWTEDCSRRIIVTDELKKKVLQEFQAQELAA